MTALVVLPYWQMEAINVVAYSLVHATFNCDMLCEICVLCVYYNGKFGEFEISTKNIFIPGYEL